MSLLIVVNSGYCCVPKPVNSKEEMEGGLDIFKTPF